MIKVGICGFCGKMGQRIFALSKADKDLKVIIGFEAKGHLKIGSLVDGVLVTDDLQKIEECDCIIDFTIPSATIKNLEYIAKFKKSAVIGTTGLNDLEQKAVKQAAVKAPIVFSPNMSIGVNVLFKLIKTSAHILKGYKVYIEEAHHIHKKDAPSGTAKKIADIVNEEGFNIESKEIKSIRQGELAGDHRIVFESEVDKIELFHHAKTRDIFARGALTAARWIVDKKKGLYSMDDVLGL